MSLRQTIGALLYDVPRYIRTVVRGSWAFMRNRNERISSDGRGARCEWEFASELHIANVFPSAGSRLMRKAFTDWPVEFRNEPEAGPEEPDISFLIGHRGVERLPHLLMSLRSIAAQTGARIECIVVEQSSEREIERRIPAWVRYIHTPLPGRDLGYCRAWAFNVAAKHARGQWLVFHDNDILVPRAYAAEILARANEGASFVDLKRFVFYLDEGPTRRLVETGSLPTNVAVRVVQNLHGGTLAASRRAFFDIGGFDEAFIGWGGEDNEFWDRAAVWGRIHGFGYLPFIHLHHAPQPDKARGREAPAIRRYYEIRDVSPRERIERLKNRDSGRMEGPSIG